MITIEALANRIADGISDQLGLDHDRRSVIAYGLIGFLQVTALLLVITVIGVVTQSLYECLIIYFSVGFMRKSTGGAHSKTMQGCNVVSVGSITLLALASRYLLNGPIAGSVSFGITLVVFVIGFVIFYLRVPIDSPNKPIVSSEKIKRLRTESFIKLIFFFLLTVSAAALADTNVRFYSIASSLRVAMIWQSLTLTESGISLLSSLDLIVNRFLEK